MRDEARIRERLQNLSERIDYLRTAMAKHVLSNEWDEADRMRRDIEHHRLTMRAIEWVLGGNA